MNHLNEDELVELYYGEGTEAGDAHLNACRECSAEYARCKRSLDAIGSTDLPGRDADYGNRVWETLRPKLIPYEKKKHNWQGWLNWKAAALMAGCAIVLAAVFLGGRYWEQLSTK
jgi:hypothetical protein